ncbi:MAG: Rod shape-determining protein MreD, partial [Sediminibacterium sp.]|nr:Rod shape-determining protein MreD [Sediminibacterium sp.]
LIEWLQFGNFVYFIGKVAGTTAISLLMILLVEMLFARTGRHRTN